jgi:hypothetical protein
MEPGSVPRIEPVAMTSSGSQMPGFAITALTDSDNGGRAGSAGRSVATSPSVGMPTQISTPSSYARCGLQVGSPLWVSARLDSAGIQQYAPVCYRAAPGLGRSSDKHAVLCFFPHASAAELDALSGGQAGAFASLSTEDKIKLFYKRLPSRRVSLRAVRRVGCREMSPSKYASTAGFNLNPLRPTTVRPSQSAFRQ